MDGASEPSQDSLVTWFRPALRAALLRHEAERAAGRETENARTVADRLLALLADKSTHEPDAVADMALRAAMAAAVTAEVEGLEKPDAEQGPSEHGRS